MSVRPPVSAGSTNFDNRSFRRNEEAYLSIYQRAFAERVSVVFEDDLRHAQRITLEQWRGCSISDQVAERQSAVLSSQL